MCLFNVFDDNDTLMNYVFEFKINWSNPNHQ